MSRLLIQISHFSFSFGANALFDNISLSIHQGEIFALIGENGAGKTTLLKLLKEAAPSHIRVGYLPQDHVQQKASLSSGQRVRKALEEALIGNPDLLLLDEPTNHLDTETLQWLKNILKRRRGATIIVSHDRKFINETCNRVIELNNGRLNGFGGNYDFYLGERERMVQRQMKAYEEQEEEKRLLKRKIKGMTFSKGKPPPAKDRNLMAYDRRGEHHQKSQKRSLDDLKGRLEEIEMSSLVHPKSKTIKGLYFTPSPLASSVAIELIDRNQTLCKGDRIILTGPNGSGKTTLLRNIISRLDTNRVRYAPTAKISYLDQEVEFLPMEKTPLEYFEERFQMSEETLRRELHKAALGGEELLRRPFSSLSTGQRKRLMLLVLVFEKPNVLLLDEPTNHLDLLTVEALEKALLDFEGAILAVSHDATFIKKIANQVWSIDDDNCISINDF